MKQKDLLVHFVYFGVNGTRINTSHTQVDYGPVIKNNDIIGCGLDFVSKQIFFTHNGKYLGVAFPCLYVFLFFYFSYFSD